MFTGILDADGAFARAYAGMLKCARSRGLFGAQSAVCAMVSGGSDSTALAYLLAAAREAGEVGAVSFLHVNHKIRAGAADADARFVKRLARALDVPLFLCEVDIPRLVQTTGGNMEALARCERYTAAREALASMCAHEGFAPAAGKIATAHTADDRIEAFFMRAIVGTGPGGFRAMNYSRGEIIRPLMDLARQDLQDAINDLATANLAVAAHEDKGKDAGEGEGAGLPDSNGDKLTDSQGDEYFARSANYSSPAGLEVSTNNPIDRDEFSDSSPNVRAGSPACEQAATPSPSPSPSPSPAYWCEDATNANTDYFRAYVRHEVIPAARKWNPALAQTLTRTMNLIADEDDMLEEIADEAVWEHVRPLVKVGDNIDLQAGFLCLPGFSGVRTPIARRALHNLLKSMLGADARIDTAAVEAILAAFDVQTGKPRGGYVANIQGNLAVSANKQGVRVEPMHAFRARRKKA